MKTEPQAANFMSTESSGYKIEHNYLPRQFADHEEIWLKIKKVVERGDFTLGKELKVLEAKWASYVGTEYALGVNSGTDALILALKAWGIRGEVIVPAFGFVASAASVVMAGAHVRFVDVGHDFNLDVDKLEAAITPSTEAIMPVHWAGRPCDMGTIMKIATAHGLLVIEDACHAIGASHNGKMCGSFGHAAAFSLHPLKNVNVWGDGGVITTTSLNLVSKLIKWRNHGLTDRNTCEHWAQNSRLDTIQAVVALHVLQKADGVIAQRRTNAKMLDEMLAGISRITRPEPHPGMTYYLYSIRAQRRDDLFNHLNKNGIDAKIHYPIPLHMQPAAAKMGCKQYDFPQAVLACKETLSLPVHEFVTPSDLEYMAQLIREFYK